jgi:hypothetical protein
MCIDKISQFKGSLLTGPPFKSHSTGHSELDYRGLRLQVNRGTGCLKIALGQSMEDTVKSAVSGLRLEKFCQLIVGASTLLPARRSGSRVLQKLLLNVLHLGLGAEG